MMTVERKYEKGKELNAIPILFFEDYIVSRDGKLYHLDLETEIHTDISHIAFDYTKKGVPIYRIIDLKDKERYLELPLDKLILNTFVGDLEGKIIHKDFDYTNCTLDNLKYELNITKVGNSYSLWINNKEFKPIPNHEKYYISNHGVIYSSYNNILRKCKFDSKLYLYININENIVKIHRLVYSTWIDEILDNMTINHMDGHKRNDYISNLEMVSRFENSRHAHNTGLKPCAKLTESDVHIICKMLEQNILITEICDHFKIYDEKERKNLRLSISRIKIKQNWVDISSQYKVENYYGVMMDDEKIHRICKLIDEGISRKNISIIENININTLKDIKKGRTYTHISSNYNFIKNKK